MVDLVFLGLHTTSAGASLNMALRLSGRLTALTCVLVIFLVAPAILSKGAL